MCRYGMERSSAKVLHCMTNCTSSVASLSAVAVLDEPACVLQVLGGAGYMRGTKSEALIAIADWYSTFSFLAGVDPTDHSAAAAGLPPIDSINM